MDKESWKLAAFALGWVEAERDPNPDGLPGACLIHEELDRFWPAGDFEGAVRDLGFDETDAAELAALIAE